MNVIETELPEIKIFEYEEFMESRGSSYSNYSKESLERSGIFFEYVEENVYCPSKKGTLYGIHFQNNPMAQAKLLYCIEGKGIDFAIDLRKESKTYKKWACVELSAENRRQIFIPKGFGHAFLSLEDNTKVDLGQYCGHIFIQFLT